MTGSNFFGRLEVIQQASTGFWRTDDLGFMTDVYWECYLEDYVPSWVPEWFAIEKPLGYIAKWLHLLKFQICLLLDIQTSEPYPDAYSVGVCVNYVKNYGVDVPSWGASWDEYQVGFGLFSNWFYTIMWESSW